MTVSNSCENGGTCNDAVNGYTCSCAAGFTGTTCHEEVDECDSNPCQNGATCEDSRNSYSCDCENGYFGQRCQTGNILLFLTLTSKK